MDDAQGIVLLALQRAGVTLPENIQSVGDLPPQQLVPIYVQALTLIRGGGSSSVPGLPTEFPQQRADRFRVCADLVVAFKQLGYREDLSFHQFLYPTEADTHRFLRFLLDQLSQTPGATTTAGGGRGRGGASRRGRAGRIGVDDLGGSKISGTVRHALSVFWDEANNSGASGHVEGGTNVGVKKRSEADVLPLESSSDEGGRPATSLGVPFRTYPLRIASAQGTTTKKKQPPLITIQAKPRSTLFPSVLELNARSAEKSARLADAQLAQLARQADKPLPPGQTPRKRVITHGVLLPSEQEVDAEVGGTDDSSPSMPELERSLSTDAEVQHRIEAPAEKEQAHISKLEEDLSTLTTEAEKLRGELAAAELESVELRQKLEGDTEKAGSLEQRLELLKTAVDLATDGARSSDDVLQELEMSVQEGQETLQALQIEWDAVKTRLDERVAESDKNAEARNSELQSKLQKMREMRQEVKDMTAKMWAREAEEAQLSAELEKVGKGATRATYVRRITELIRNSKKQDADIARIIHDTRELQRESNMSQDKLRRLHALVDETIFRDAKRDPVCKQAYRVLTTIHGNFENIVAKVLEMDKIQREISELQAKVEDLQKRPLDKASVEADLEAIVAENRALERRLVEAAASNVLP